MNKLLILLLIMITLSCNNKKEPKLELDIILNNNNTEYKVVHLNWKYTNSNGIDSILHGIPIEKNAKVTFTLEDKNKNRIQIKEPILYFK